MMYRIFGDAPAIKIIDWMLENQEYDHSVKELADGAGLSMSVTRQNMGPVLANGVAVVNRTVGRDAMYVLDMTNRCTKAIIEFDKQIARCCEAVVLEVDATPEAQSEDDDLDEMDEAHEMMMAGPPEH